MDRGTFESPAAAAAKARSAPPAAPPAAAALVKATHDRPAAEGPATKKRRMAEAPPALSVGGPVQALRKATAPALKPQSLEAPAKGLHPELAAALSALPPPGPGDATPEQRRELLATALMAGAMRAQNARQSSRTYGNDMTSSEVRDACRVICRLRVRIRSRRQRRLHAACRARLPAFLSNLAESLSLEFSCSTLQAVPGVWIKKTSLREALGFLAGGTFARIEGQKLGKSGLAVLYGRKNLQSYIMLRPTTAAAAAGLPPTPGAAELAAAAAAVAAELALPFQQQPFSTELQALAPGLPPDLAAAMAALPPPGPGDASAHDRTELRRGGRSAGALPTLAELPDPGDWKLSTGTRRAAEIRALCAAVRLLRVRSCAAACSTPLPSSLISEQASDNNYSRSDLTRKECCPQCAPPPT
jgi:hypothetical protein